MRPPGWPPTIGLLRGSTSLIGHDDAPVLAHDLVGALASVTDIDLVVGSPPAR